MQEHLDRIVHIHKTGPMHHGTARAAVCYYYDQPSVRGKQELKKPVRFMTTDEKLDVLARAGALILQEMAAVSRSRRMV